MEMFKFSRSSRNVIPLLQLHVQLRIILWVLTKIQVALYTSHWGCDFDSCSLSLKSSFSITVTSNVYICTDLIRSIACEEERLQRSLLSPDISPEPLSHQVWQPIALCGRRRKLYGISRRQEARPDSLFMFELKTLACSCHHFLQEQWSHFLLQAEFEWVTANSTELNNNWVAAAERVSISRTIWLLGVSKHHPQRARCHKHHISAKNPKYNGIVNNASQV